MFSKDSKRALFRPLQKHGYITHSAGETGSHLATLNKSKEWDCNEILRIEEFLQLHWKAYRNAAAATLSRTLIRVVVKSDNRYDW